VVSKNLKFEAHTNIKYVGRIDRPAIFSNKVKISQQKYFLAKSIVVFSIWYKFSYALNFDFALNLYYKFDPLKFPLINFENSKQLFVASNSPFKLIIKIPKELIGPLVAHSARHSARHSVRFMFLCLKVDGSLRL
jgi:hypothetical protein